jgi:hypothetical protein
VVAEPGGMLSYILYVSLFGPSERAKVCPSDGFGKRPWRRPRISALRYNPTPSKERDRGNPDVIVRVFVQNITGGREREKIVIFKMKNERNKQI